MFKISEKLSVGNICIGSFYNKWFGLKQGFVSYGAVNNKLIEQGSKLNKPIKDAMFLGRLEEETGIMEYLKAINGTNIKLDVFGAGSLEKQAKEYAKQNKLNISFKGFVANATDYIKDFKYIFSSRYLGILEAMALKKPVFAVYNNKIKQDYLEMTPFSKFIAISKDGEHVNKDLENYAKGKSTINIDEAYTWAKTQTWENMVTLYLKLWNRL
jgi:glycosyltransferase involved in cell wall biosynthesis